MKAQRLCDVLKLRPAKKWAVLQNVAASRDGSLLGELSMKDKGDCATVAQLMKLMRSEQKKHDHDHVVLLIRAIRWCFLDDEDVFQALVNGGLSGCILAAIKELREKASSGIEGTAPTLQLLLANISDMFEWDFFGEGEYKLFVEEMLLILTSCNDCDGTLYTEAACVLMSMCSTTTESVCKSLLTSKKCSSLMGKMLHALPHAKSFFYEALLLELAYRIQRHGKKKQDEQIARIAAKLIDAFPVQVGRSLPSIQPKNFREETRQLLNEFNLSVGVIRSFKLLKLQCSQLSKSKICIEPTGWIDFGGTTLEIEVTAGVSEKESSSTLKLPYKHIQSLSSKDNANQIVVCVSDAVSLAEVLEGIDDQAWSKIKGFSLVLGMELNTHAKVKDLLEERLGARKETKLIVVESKTIKQEAIETVAALMPAKVARDPKPVKLSTHQRQPKPVRKDIEHEQRPSTEKVDAEAVDRARTGIVRAQQRKANDAEKKRNIVKDQGGAELSRLAMEHSTRPLHASPDKQAKPSIVYVSPLPLTAKPRALKNVAEKSIGARTSLSSEELLPTSQDEDAIVVPDDEEAVQAVPTRRKRSFREAQTQYVHRLQALVEDIVKTNDEYREFSIAALCYNVAAQSDKLLTRTRCTSEEADHFESTSCALDESDATRASERARRNDAQEKMEQVVAQASVLEAKLVQSTKTILAGVETMASSEWRQDLERVHKKLRTQASQSVTQVKQKLSAIEKAFNTDDLHAMQQMMQRI